MDKASLTRSDDDDLQILRTVSASLMLKAKALQDDGKHTEATHVAIAHAAVNAVLEAVARLKDDNYHAQQAGLANVIWARVAGHSRQERDVLSSLCWILKRFTLDSHYTEMPKDALRLADAARALVGESGSTLNAASK